LRQNGSVLSAPADGEVEVQVGSMRLTLPLREVERLEPDEPSRTASPTSPILIEKSFGVPDEIHLRGLTVDEALPELDKYLDDAYLAGRRTVRIIHGKGTGALREAVRRYLRQHPHIASFEYAQAIEGGIGATVAQMRTE
jgi:DNA mismatch repair protein MutS2